MTNLSFSDLLTNFKKEKSDELVGIVFFSKINTGIVCGQASIIQFDIKY